jgi:hypothetical protein
MCSCVAVVFIRQLTILEMRDNKLCSFLKINAITYLQQIHRNQHRKFAAKKKAKGKFTELSWSFRVKIFLVNVTVNEISNNFEH